MKHTLRPSAGWCLLLVSGHLGGKGSIACVMSSCRRLHLFLTGKGVYTLFNTLCRLPMQLAKLGCVLLQFISQIESLCTFLNNLRCQGYGLRWPAMLRRSAFLNADVFSEMWFELVTEWARLAVC